MVLGDNGPAVGQQPRVALAGIDHRFDREHHARVQFHARAGLAVVQHLRIFMINAADTVAAVFPHHRIARGLGVSLDGVTDVAQLCAGLHGIDAVHHGLETGFRKPLRQHRRLADVVHAAGVAVVAVLDDGDVDIDDIATFEYAVVGNAVADHMIDRRTDGFGEAAIADVGRNRLLDVHDVVVADGIQRLGTHAGVDMFANYVQNVGCQAPGYAQFLLFFQ